MSHPKHCEALVINAHQPRRSSPCDRPVKAARKIRGRIVHVCAIHARAHSIFAVHDIVRGDPRCEAR